MEIRHEIKKFKPIVIKIDSEKELEQIMHLFSMNSQYDINAYGEGQEFTAEYKKELNAFNVRIWDRLYDIKQSLMKSD